MKQNKRDTLHEMFNAITEFPYMVLPLWPVVRSLFKNGNLRRWYSDRRLLYKTPRGLPPPTQPGGPPPKKNRAAWGHFPIIFCAETLGSAGGESSHRPLPRGGGVFWVEINLLHLHFGGNGIWIWEWISKQLNPNNPRTSSSRELDELTASRPRTLFFGGSGIKRDSDSNATALCAFLVRNNMPVVSNVVLQLWNIWRYSTPEFPY